MEGYILMADKNKSKELNDDELKQVLLIIITEINAKKNATSLNIYIKDQYITNNKIINDVEKIYDLLKYEYYDLIDVIYKFLYLFNIKDNNLIKRIIDEQIKNYKSNYDEEYNKNKRVNTYYLLKNIFEQFIEQINYKIENENFKLNPFLQKFKEYYNEIISLNREKDGKKILLLNDL